MKLLFNYLPYPMKDSDPVVRSTKKASTKATTNGTGNTKITKFFSSFYSSSSNNTTGAPTNGNGTSKKKAPNKSTGKDDKTIERRVRKKKDSESNTAQEDLKAIANGTKRKKIAPSSQTSLSVASSSSSSTSSSASTLSSTSSAPTIISDGKASSLSTPTKRKKLKKKVKKGNSKLSPTLRPRRRASQTYFFKYQLARNPLKAEEEDLKLALLASLQQCDDGLSKEQLQEQLKRQQLIYENHLQNHKQPKKGVQSNHHQPPSKQQKQKHPPPQKTVVLNNNPTPPAYDEEYLKRYRPETEDFLTFICFRTSAQNYTFPEQQNELPNVPTASGSLDHLSNINMKPLNGYVTTSTTTGIHVKINNDKISNEYHNLRRSTSPCKSSASNQTASNSSPNHLNSPCNRRRPTRHSPRLASSSRKISEYDSLNHYTAYDNQINYEEDMKKASIALEDMAQEIIRSDDNELAQNHKHPFKIANDAAPPTGGITSSGTKSPSPFKNNKHLVKGLMTREFAGAFADEEIIFESIKNT